MPFSKDNILPHQTKTVQVKLDFSSFACYNVSLDRWYVENVSLDRWYVENGDFEVLVGGSSRNLPLKLKLRVELPQEEQFSDG